MSNTLYRKYRPQNWGEIDGQAHITSLLSATADAKTPSHAYLFTGSRGTGKTTTARVFADALGIVSEDIVEIDAASYRGIDDIRQLRDSVNTLPFRSEYRLYIIDEVHMLTTEAFNALLKTLEEPPQHIIFVLATTDAHKIPDTIISRCQVCNFVRPGIDSLTDRVADIAKREGIKLQTESARLIAIAGDGSYRDAIGALQRLATSMPGKEISVESTAGVLGIPPVSTVIQFLEKCISGDSAAIDTLTTLRESGQQEKHFTDIMIDIVRDILLLRLRSDGREVSTKYGDHDFKLLQKMSQGREVNSKLLARILDQYRLINLASAHPFLATELLLTEILDNQK